MVKASYAKDTAKYISDIIDKLDAGIETMEGSDNPQVIQAVVAKKIERETLYSVLYSLNGNHVNLKIMMGA